MRKYFILLAVLTALYGVAITLNMVKANAAATSVDPVEVVESSAEHLVLQLTLPDHVIDSVVMLDGNSYQMFSVEGAGYPPEGKPDVPVFIRSILVPNGRTVHLEVDPGDPEIIYDDILLNPVQAPYADLEDSSISDFVKDEETYARDSVYPGVWAEIEPVEVMRGQEMVEVRFYPYQHNPVEETLHIYPNLRVNISFEGDIQPIPDRLQSEIFDDIYRRKAINADEILEAEKAVETPTEPKYGPYGWDYLIFTDPDFEQAANKLAAWKQKMGYKTLVTKVPKKWGAQDIKDALVDAYYNWDTVPEYVLLIGDSEFIPPFYKTWHIYNSTKYKGNINTQGRVGTDLYYSTLESAGNIINPNGDLVPEVLLGRLSVDEPYEAMDRVNAIINYEKNPPSDASFYNNVVMASQFQDGGSVVVQTSIGTTFTHVIDPDDIEDRRFTQTTEDIALFLGNTPVNKTIKRMYFADPGSSPKKWNDNKQEIQTWKNFNGINTQVGVNLPSHLLGGFQWNADATKIKTAVNAGSFLVTHRDHGGRMRWSQPRLEGIWDVALLTNQDLLPVVWSYNCQTGWFDNETDFKATTGLADLTTVTDEAFSEFWERPLASAISDHDYGAVGIVAPTRVTYGTYNARLFMGMTEAIWPKYTNSSSTAKSLYQMGAVLNHGKAFMSQNTSSGITETLQLEGYHYFGDPSMEIRTEKPPLMIALAETPWHWALHRHDLPVTVNWLDDGSTAGPVEKAKVTLSNPEISADHWAVVTDEEGVAVFTDIKTSTAGVYDLTVSAANHIPVTTTIEVLPGPAGGIGLDEEVYACESEITIIGADSDLSGTRGMPVLVTTSAGDSERLVLEETEMAGFFRGLLETGSGRVNPGDMILQVSDGDIITASYEDEDDGTRGRAGVEDSAEVDCQAPIFDGLETITQEGCYATLKWDAADERHGLVYYNIYRSESPGPPIGEKIGNTWALSTSDYICSSGQPYYYVIRAEDAVGNEDENMNEGSVQPHRLFLPLIYR